jgi:AraC-like DNA-binding protein
MGSRLSVREYGASHACHSHSHFQVLVGLDGVLELEVEGRGRRITADTGFVVQPGERHDFESAGGSRCLVLDSEDAMWQRCDAAPAHPLQAHALARYLSHAVPKSQAMASLHGPSLLLEAWLPATTPGHRVRRTIDWAALAAWLQHRLAEPLTVTDLAARAYLSPSQFALRCQEAHGMSPMEWLRLQRLARAAQLRAAGLPVAETARRSGYRSPSALTAALRRQRIG